MSMVLGILSSMCLLIILIDFYSFEKSLENMDSIKLLRSHPDEGMSTPTGLHFFIDHIMMVIICEHLKSVSSSVSLTSQWSGAYVGVIYKKVLVHICAYSMHEHHILCIYVFSLPN